MQLCIPVNADNGIDSEVCAHFGSAPLFAIVDTDSGSMSLVDNSNKHHRHGMCQPLMALGGHQIDAVLVGGIGMGALTKLNAANVAVYLYRDGGSVKDALDAFAAGSLAKAAPHSACGGHGGGCGHGHGHGHGRSTP